MSPKEIVQKLREFKITTLAVDNGTSIFLLAAMILIFGIQGYMSMPKEQYPEAFLPKVFINTPYFGNSAEDIENLIARPIEKEIQTIPELKDVTSTSVQDFSVVIAEFSSDIDIDDAVRKVKDAVDKAKPELPTDLTTDPDIKEILFSEFPIMTINVAGPYQPDELKKHADYLKDKIENFSEISRVDLKGARDKEMIIAVNIPVMESLRVNFMDIETAIARENMNLSAGELKSNEFKRSIRVLGEFKSAKDIGNTIIKSELERPIYLRDIATVSFDYEDPKSYARSDGLPVIALEVVKRGGENLLFASDKIKSLLETEASALPEDLNLEIFNDQSLETRDGVDALENSIISGVILVILVLLFFLGLRNATFVGLAIPLSMLMGIMILNLAGITMNIVVLFGLILALGLLVDNGIVVVENIYRYMQNGYTGLEAAKFGAGEVAVPIIVSTITTLAAFIPMLFWPGLMGMFMQYLPLTLIIVLGSSLFIALVINPVFTSRFMKVDAKADTKDAYIRKVKNTLIGALIMLSLGIAGHLFNIMWLRNLMGIALIVSLVNFFLLRPASFGFQNRVLPLLEKGYDRFIRFTLSGFNPLIAFFAAFLMLFGAIYLLTIKSPKVEYFPNPDPQYANVFVELPVGKDIETTNRVVKELEVVISDLMQDYDSVVKAILTQIGEDTADPNRPPEPGLTPHRARITVSFVPADERGDISTRDLVDLLRTQLVGYPGIDIITDVNNSGPPSGLPIAMEISGDNIDTLIKLSGNLIDYINNQYIPGIDNLQPDIKTGKPELLVNINRENARRYGISTGQIASTIRTSVFGKEISKFKLGEDDYPINLKAATTTRNSIDAIMNQKVTFRDQARRGEFVQIPISSVAEYQYSSAYTSIKRRNQTRSINITSNVLEGYNATEINQELESLMAGYDFPDNYYFEFRGEAEEQRKDMMFLVGAMLIAVFAIFIILVAQFNSLITPFIIVLSILFSTIGVFLGYVAFGNVVSVVMSGVGIISLAGIVVNNAIVLVDYINLLISNKKQELGVSSAFAMDKSDIKEAIIAGGGTRLRPVLLTAITTVLGLVPLAIGFNFNFFTLISDLDPQIFIGGDNVAMWGPMAWTVIYGLSFATFLTLVLVPVMYWLAFRLKAKFVKVPPKAVSTVADQAIINNELASTVETESVVTIKEPAPTKTINDPYNLIESNHRTSSNNDVNNPQLISKESITTVDTQKISQPQQQAKRSQEIVKPVPSITQKEIVKLNPVPAIVKKPKVKKKNKSAKKKNKEKAQSLSLGTMMKKKNNKKAKKKSK